MPPRIATANALMPNSVPIVDEMVNSGATRMPATPASKPDSANEKVDHAAGVDAHQPRRVGVLHDREQRLAVARIAEEEMQRQRERKADHRDQRSAAAGS